MAGNIAGGKNAADTNKKKYGEDFYVIIGRRGGQNGTTGGFYANRKLASIAGAEGGRKGSRAGIKNGAGKSSKSLKRYKEKALLEAYKDFQEGFYETLTWSQRIIRRFK